MIIDKLISFHIEKQFPAIYREDGQELVQFIKEYYKFLETDTHQSLFNGRRIYEYKDIDTTLDRMILFFKNKYLADLPFDDSTTRFIVKNILALYRRKGTKEGLQMFFRLFYGENISLYYPAKDMLRPSNSQWKTRNYLEIVPNQGFFTSTETDKTYTYADILGKQIIGASSNATAVVDKINFIILKNTILPIIFLDNLKNKFIKRENIVCLIDGAVVEFGAIRGSATEIEIDQVFSDATLGNEVGQRITTAADVGIGIKGIVSKITDTFTGIVDYSVLDGGWGYSIDSTRLLVSNQSLFYTGQTANNLIPGEPIADQLGNAGIFVGLNAVSIGVRLDPTKEFEDTSVISTTNRIPIETIFLAKDPAFSFIITLSDAIARAANGIEPEKTLFDAIVSGSRKLGDITNDGNITQQDVIELNSFLAGTQTNQDIINYINGEFNDFLKSNTFSYGSYPARKIIITSIIEKNDSSPGNLFPDTQDPNDVIVSDLINKDAVSLIFDVIGDYANVDIDSTNYNDPPAVQQMSGGANTVNINTPLDEAFNLVPIEFGTIVGFNNINPGADYINDTFAIAEDSVMIDLDRNPQAITLASIPITLSVGNEVLQNGTKAKVLSIQGNTIIIRPYSYFGFNGNDPILFGGSSIPILFISTVFLPRESSGKNASIFSTTNFAVGRITDVAVIDSGYKYRDGEIVNIIDENGNIAARGTVKTDGVGFGQGFWSSLDSHLNGYVSDRFNDLSYFESGKRIQDSDFYQEYSYEISSKIDFGVYEASLKEIAHVAGTKVFGKFNLEDIKDVSVNASITIVS